MIDIDESATANVKPLLPVVLGFSVLSQRPVRIHFSGHQELIPRNLTSIEAISEVCSARTLLDESEGHLVFEPRSLPEGNNYQFDVFHTNQVTDSGALVPLLQTLIVLLTYAEKNSTLSLRGGTHVPGSPPPQYVRDVYGQIIEQLGYEFDLEINRREFSRGNDGIIETRVYARGNEFIPDSICLNERGDLKAVDGYSAVGNLPSEILHRQTTRVTELLKREGFKPEIESRAVESFEPGTAVYLLAKFESVPAGFWAYGRKDKRAARVAEEAVQKLLDHLSAGVPVQLDLGEQLLLPMALSNKESVYVTTEVIDRLRTIVGIIRKLDLANIRLERQPDGFTAVHLNSTGN